MFLNLLMDGKFHKRTLPQILPGTCVDHWVVGAKKSNVVVALKADGVALLKKKTFLFQFHFCF